MHLHVFSDCTFGGVWIWVSEEVLIINLVFVKIKAFLNAQAICIFFNSK